MKVLQLTEKRYWFLKNEFCFAIQNDRAKTLIGFISEDNVEANRESRLDYKPSRDDTRIIYESNSGSATK